MRIDRVAGSIAGLWMGAAEVNEIDVAAVEGERFELGPGDGAAGLADEKKIREYDAELIV